MRLLRYLALALLLLGCGLPARAGEGVAGNLVANPGFEQVRGGFPAGWGTFDERASGLVALDRHEVFAGEFALRVTGDPAESWQPLFSDGLKVEPGGAYTLGCYCKSLVKSGTQILFALREIGADGQSIRFSQVPVPLQAEWAFRSQRITLAEKTTSVQVFIVLQKCDGTVWFDDLLLVKGDLPDLGALQARQKRPATRPAPPEVPLYANLLPNGGLEKAEGNLPQGWAFVAGEGQQGAADEARHLAGGGSFRQEHPAAGLPGSYLHPAAPVAVTPNAAYRLSAWAMTAPGCRSGWTSVAHARGQRAEGVCLQLLFLDEGGKTVSQAWSRAIATNGAWQALAVVGQAPGNAATADVRLFHGDLRGASWFDAARLQRVEKADDLRPLWAFPREEFDAGALPPSLRMLPKEGRCDAALVDAGRPGEYALSQRCAGEGAGALLLPAVDASFPGTFRVAGECRRTDGAGQVRLLLSSLSVDGARLAGREVPLDAGADWTPFTADYTPDPMAATFTASLSVAGRDLGIQVRQPRVEQVSRLTLDEYARQAFPDTAAPAGPAGAAAPPASSAAVASAPAKRVGLAASPAGPAGAGAGSPAKTAGAAGSPKVEFAPRNGLPALLVNGQPLPLSQYWYADPPTGPQIEACRRAGLIQTISLMDIDWSKEPAGIAWEALDRQIRDVLQRAPDAWIMICPDTTAEHGKVSWVRSHPDQAYTNDLAESSVESYSGESRRFPSFASAKWLADVNAMLTELVAHVKAADYAGRVIGYQLSGYEWFQWEWMKARMDVSTHMRDAFRSWLREKYGTPERLQSAWGRPGLAIDQVAIPSTAERRKTVDGVFRDPVAQRGVTDFSRFYNDLIAGVLLSQARTIKQAAGRKTLVSCFYAYHLQMFDGPARESSGHLALKKLLDSGLIEVTGAPSDGYQYERGLGGTGGFMTLPGSYALHGARYMDQPDFRTHWSPQDVERTATAAEDVSIFRREFALALTNDVPIQYLDFSRSWAIGDPRIVEEMRRFGAVERFAQSLDRKPTAQGMAVLFSEETADFVGTERNLFDGGLTYHQRPLLYRSGMPHRYYLLSDLANPRLPDYKVWVFPNAFRLTAEERALIRRKCMRNRNVVVFVYAPGIVDEKSVSPANMERLLGFPLAKLLGQTEAKVAIAPAGKHPWLRSSAGITYGQGIGWPLYTAADKSVQVLGNYAGTDKPGLVLRDFGSYKVVYSGAPMLPPDLWRDLGRLAGAHITCETNDALYADGDFVGLHARTPGLKRLALPRRADVYDLIHRKVLARGVDHIEVPMRGFDTALFYIGDAARAAAWFKAE